MMWYRGYYNNVTTRKDESNRKQKKKSTLIVTEERQMVKFTYLKVMYSDFKSLCCVVLCCTNEFYVNVSSLQQ